MGVKEGVQQAIDNKVLAGTRTMCIKINCTNAIVPLTLTQEDEALITYDGACTLCGAQYTLMYEKDNP